MPYLFPTDSEGRAGAVEPTADGNGFRIPTLEKGSEALSGADIQRVTTAGVRVQLPDIPCRKIMLIGLRSNTGSIYVGGNLVSNTVYGAEMLARDSLTIEVSNANLLWIDASVSGEGVSYFAI